MRETMFGAVQFDALQGSEDVDTSTWTSNSDLLCREEKGFIFVPRARYVN